jgi:hypothetical protein
VVSTQSTTRYSPRFFFFFFFFGALDDNGGNTGPGIGYKDLNVTGRYNGD